MPLSQESYNQLALYTLGLRDSYFIHQLIVDSYAAQNADASTKPITLTFALVGLYLNVESECGANRLRVIELADSYHLSII